MAAATKKRPRQITSIEVNDVDEIGRGAAMGFFLTWRGLMDNIRYPRVNCRISPIMLCATHFRVYMMTLMGRG
jgi:hypothetical protein